MILAIDPGNEQSAYVYMTEHNLQPKIFGKCNNYDLLGMIQKSYQQDHAAIEMVASYGMAVGKEVFETCVWIGRFTEALTQNSTENIKYIYRKDEKINLCGSMKAKDSNIRQALIDRFAQHDIKNGKGTKLNPDWFFGFHSDIWQAYAVGVTYYDLYLNKAS